MSEVSTYLLEVHTGNDYDLTTYDDAAGAFINMLVELLSTDTTLDQLVSPTRTHCCSSIDVGLEDVGRGRELVARIVVDISGENPSPFNKSKWTKLLNATPESSVWIKPKILKSKAPTPSPYL